MTTRQRSGSFGSKLTAAIVGTSSAALLLGAAGFAAYDWQSAREALSADLHLMADVLGTNMRSALEFDDTHFADEELQKLARHKHVQYACLYDATGAPFAQWHAPGIGAVEAPAQVEHTSASIEDGLARVVHPIVIGDKQIGSLFLQSDDSTVQARTYEIVRMVGGGWIACVALSWLLAKRLQERVSGPLVALTGTARRVREAGDYTLRAEARSNDEVGELVDSFNRMLEEIHARDAELGRHRERLEEDVRARTADLELVNTQLRKSMEEAKAATIAKSQFLANMSHEIRTPMNGVIGMTTVLMDTKLDSHQQDIASTVLQSAESLLVLLNDILDFSKIEAGRLELESIEFALRPLVEDCLHTLSSKAAEKRLELVSMIAREVPERVRGDPSRLRQIVMNLCGNALKFTERGEVVVEVRRVVASPGRESRLRFMVRDTGMGIPPERLGRLFQMFSQVDTSTTRRFGGTGLGLAISRSLVLLMKGEIGVESELGQGSTFWFELPLPGVQGEAWPSAPLPREIPRSRVLVVDDNTTNRRVVREYATNWCRRCDEAASANEGLALMRAARAEGEPYALVFVDHDMPEINGEEFGRTAAADPELSQTPLVMLTSLGGAADVDRMRSIGFAAYLVKPLRLARFEDCLKAILDGRHEVEKRSGGILTDAKLRESCELRHARILVAEDNGVNQKVARALLSKLGYPCEIQPDGLQAIRAVEKRAYDLILMDCQMPECDGYEATRRLRAAGVRTPIVAMTANSMTGDRERCLEAGMDDFLSKPVTPAALRAILERWVGAKSERDGTTAAARGMPAPPGTDGDGATPAA
jgi:signal transduction histidine kinase/DNA-binding response OmpR family regulator